MQRRRLTSTVNDWNIVSSKLQTFLNSLNYVEIKDAAQLAVPLYVEASLPARFVERVLS
jgi:hypothetical protein